ncbi:hypothetical protein BDB00DRAFT_962087 [Zychaea mexicana]|uniref:uncharacterized protein n=1 Tax=Zychaea mexicana TaxID=64656 RepID=UPI0022FF141A|nr:uncharacterized protein BDB00DRAFT_962087 [Zychaea mexicana]KAI9489636.1 hypothetical protein BDB00DRAFT_962087 [Zychaea mexicana]
MSTTIVEFCTPPVPGERHKYYGDAHNKFIKLPQLATTATTKTTVESSPHRTLHSLASSGSLPLFKRLLLHLPDPLKAVNDPHPSTGLTPIHFAASRGHVEIVRCLVEDYHVSVDSRDKEGETPLLKASYAGHYHVVQYLLSKKANIHQKDKDGWTALHNACSRGYLPVARLLLERGAHVNAQNKMGHTPLINAASKGYMSIVEYLLEEANANPLIKNNFEEAAYDVSAASGEAGEAYICEMLERAGTKWWHQRHTEGVDLSPYSRGSTYDLLEFHVTVMVILHENQRSTSILGLSRPQFSPNALTKHDTRGPWSLHPSGIPSDKERVELPQIDQTRPEAGTNWFWLTEWQIDYSDPRVDPTSGWQYARSFDERDEGWTPVAPTAGYGWVRRRRWVRVMKRRMDLTKGSHRGEDESVATPQQKDYLAQADELVQHAKDSTDVDTTGDPTTQMLRQLTHELRVYEEAVQLLLAGIKTDTNQYRKHEASILVKSHTGHVEQLNARITALGSKLSTPVGPVQHNAELARELGFTTNEDNTTETPSAQLRQHQHHHQQQQRDMIGYIDETGPGAADFDSNPWSRDSATQQHQQQQKQQHLQEPAWLQPHNESSSTLNHVDLMGHDAVLDLGPSAAALETAVDDNSGPRQFTWESDTEARECRRCARRFGILVRRHHCRRCGLIVCDKCSSSRTYLSPSEIVQDPNGPFESFQVLASHHQRVCDKCYADLGTEGRV